MAASEPSPYAIKKYLEEMHVLIVDDEQFDRDLLEAVLKRAGLQNIMTVDSGAAAAARVESMLELKVGFGLVFLDWKMPVRDGKSTLRMLRRQFADFDAGVFITTATSSAEAVQLFLGEGAQDFIVKPCTLEIVQPKIERFIAKRLKKNAA